MKLIHTNPYLKGNNRKTLAARSTITSCGVEGVKIDLAKLSISIPHRSKQTYDDTK